ncbi:glycosyltransferase [Hymenobacter radiodurans]|uniref:glycosyltransferase n=1 Tax=Hymenobacter radiodurans TaxID=2496028 RepID=UPI00105877C9|nr:glycosyltransferase [Hymenobacter radiodurans]
MRIAFVSLMRVLPWGGSEELWFKAAKLALADGHTVSTLTQKWETVPDKIKELRFLGADNYFYYKPQFSIAERLAIKLKVKSSTGEIVPTVVADVYVISNGTTWDFVQHRMVIENILSQGKPYILINQHNYEHGNIVTGLNRDYAIKVVQHASMNFFVAKRNMETAERQLAHFINSAQIISNPVNIAVKAVKPYVTSSQLQIACVARIDCDYKGQDILLQALATHKWRDRNYHLSLYGTGPHLNHLQHLIYLYELQAKVSIKGHVNDIDKIWEENHILVLPSISEGTPLALVEAMLCGRTALVTDVGDNAQYIIDGVTGFLSSTASVKCVSLDLERLWENRENIQEMGRKAFEHASGITDLHPEKTLIKFIESL